MTMERISTELYGHLMRNGLQPRPVGAVKGSGKKMRPAATEGAGPRVAATGREVEVSGGLEMITSKWRTIRARPLLAIIDGGRS